MYRVVKHSERSGTEISSARIMKHKDEDEVQEELVHCTTAPSKIHPSTSSTRIYRRIKLERTVYRYIVRMGVV